MSEPIVSLPPRGRATSTKLPRLAGKLLGVFCWLVFLCAAAVLAAGLLLRSEHRAETDRRHALAGEQRSVAAAAAVLALDRGGEEGSPAARSDVLRLRHRALEILARLPPDPAAGLLPEWLRLAAALEVAAAEWPRVLLVRAELEALRPRGWALRERSIGFTDTWQVGSGDLRGRAAGEALVVLSRRIAEALGRAVPAEPESLDRAAELLGVYGGSLALLLEEAPRRAGDGSSPGLALAALAARSGVIRRRLAQLRQTGREPLPVAGVLASVTARSARIRELVPAFEAHAARPPVLSGVSLDTWLLGAGGSALAGLLGLLWRRQHGLAAEADDLDQAWVEAAESDWRARALVRDLVRAIRGLDRTPSRPAALEEQDTEVLAREAAAALSRIVTGRAQAAVALAQARDSLRKAVADAREVLSGRPAAPLGPADLALLIELEAAFRRVVLFGAANVVREIRVGAAVHAREGGAPGDPDQESGDAIEPFRELAHRGFALVERCIDRAAAGEDEERASLVFLLDDFRAVREAAPFSASIVFEPDLSSGGSAAAPEGDPDWMPDAAGLFSSFRLALEDWTAGAGGDEGGSAARLRDRVTALARVAEAGAAPARGFWRAAAAFCAALAEGAIPRGPTVRRILDEVAGEFEAVARGETGQAPAPRLFRELLLYAALAASDHVELQAVRTAFDLGRHPIVIPEHPRDAEPVVEEWPEDVPREIIHQLEDLRTVLDRMDRPPGAAGRLPTT